MSHRQTIRTLGAGLTIFGTAFLAYPGLSSAWASTPASDVAISVTGPDLAHVGDTVNYTLTVTDPGTLPMTNVTVADPECSSAPASQGAAGTDLSPGDTWTYSCLHVVSADDASPIVSTATVTGVDPSGNTETATAVQQVLVIHPSVSLTSSASPAAGAPGSPVTYTYEVANNGDTVLTPVVITDQKLGTIGVIAGLAPGASRTLTKSSTIGTSTVADVGTVTATDPLGMKVTASAVETVTPKLLSDPTTTTTTLPAASTAPGSTTPASTTTDSPTPASTTSTGAAVQTAQGGLPSALAFTGRDTVPELETAGGSVFVGAVLLILGRRRRS